MASIRKHIILLCTNVWCLVGLAQTVAIPDTEFLKYLKSNYPAYINAQDQLILSQASTLSDTLSLKNLNIKNAQGVQYFVNIRGLNLGNNQLQSLPSIGKLEQLQTLYLKNNQLTVLPPVDSLRNLTNLYVDNNKLSQLPDLSKNLKLLSIQASRNNLSSLPPLSTLNKVNILDVSYNKLTSLPNLSGMAALERLYCSGNQLATLPSLSNLSNLKRINISRNNLSSLPSLADNTQLYELVADSNQLTFAPNLNNLTSITKIQLQNNLLTFDDLVQYLSHSNYGSMSYDYSPQKRTNTRKTVQVQQNDSLTLKPYHNDTLKGLSYTWYRNGSVIVKSATPNYFIPSTTISDSGHYYCRITHPSLPALTLVSDTTHLKVQAVNNPTQCPILKSPTMKISPASCTQLASIELGFAPKLTDSINVELYDSNMVLVGGTSKTLYTGLRHGNYQLMIKPSNPQCVGNLQKEVTIVSEQCTEVVLTPNNDGKDDTLYMSQKGVATVFDKNGKTVKTLSIPAEWDGSNSDGTLPQGYYLVKINNGTDYIHVSIIY